MPLRSIQEIVLHLHTFRNIQLWYQGYYFLRINIYPLSQKSLKQKIYAHPFAHTQNYQPKDHRRSHKQYENQIVRTAFIQEESSTFVSKMFLLKYFEEEIQLNDICHFRIESDVGVESEELVIQIKLNFYDSHPKKVGEQLGMTESQIEDTALKNSKTVKTVHYRMRNTKEGVHEYRPGLFNDQYFSLLSMNVHSVCLDYRFRVSNMQLCQFTKLSNFQKAQLIEKNKTRQIQKLSYFQSITKSLDLQTSFSALNKIEDILIKSMKENHDHLLKEYTSLFTKVITEKERKAYAQLLVQPSQCSLFQEENASDYLDSFEEIMLRKYKSKSPEQIVQKMLNEANLISAQLMKLWKVFIDLIKISPRFICVYYEQHWTKMQYKFWSSLYADNEMFVDNLELANQDGFQQQQKQLLERKKKVNFNLNIVDQLFLSGRNELPVVISNRYFTQKGIKQTQGQKSPIFPGIHLVIFVHGFQGNSYDMQLIKNYISFVYPESSLLASSSNEQQTDSDIIQMGNRLAVEIKTYILQNFQEGTLEKISFIGHSLGGLKIRASLPNLLEYQHKFHAFMTFSSPHLGYKVNASSVIEAGIWVLQKFKDSLSLNQLQMADNKNPYETCLYQMSKFEGLDRFKHIYLFSSKQDSYAPYESARIEINPSFNSKDPLVNIHCEMVKNLLSGIKSGVLRRVNVTFNIGENNLDSIIGRTAHIRFLESHQMMKAILFTQTDLFA